MPNDAPSEEVSTTTVLLGRLVGGPAILFLLLNGVTRLLPWAVVTEAVERMGYGSSESLARALGAISIPCSALLTIPPTSFVGAILWTSYLGDILATHLRIF